MKSPTRHPMFQLLPIATLLCVVGGSSHVAASTIAQNVSWTIDRPESETTYRIVAYGDSIFAGYKGSISNVAIYAAPTVDGEYASNEWGTDVEIVRRAKSGAKAGDVYRSKIVDDASYMQTPETRVVAFEMCGNDALGARNDFSGQNGTCDFSRLDGALSKCTRFVRNAMVFINANAHANVKRKVISNLYYASYDVDDTLTSCTDESTGLSVNKQDAFLPYLVRMNWRMCNFASEYGFECADTFAEFMGADYDSNGDRRKDTKALRYRQGESEDDYVQRLTVTLRDTIRDANFHFVRPSRSFDYLLSDDTHPTYRGRNVSLGLLGGSGGGSSEPRFTPAQYERRRGKNPVWKKYGHERMGTEMSKFNPPAP
ncbi:MAG: SGNH/GDSL hydrolase family protein [Candidatus Binatia bacterium]